MKNLVSTEHEQVDGACRNILDGAQFSILQVKVFCTVFRSFSRDRFNQTKFAIRKVPAGSYYDMISEHRPSVRNRDHGQKWKKNTRSIVI